MRRHPAAPLALQTLVHSLDPRNATLEPETYGDADAAKYGERKPLIWFWMRHDRSPWPASTTGWDTSAAMPARHVFKHCGNNVKIFHGVEFSFGYNLTVQDNCTIHKNDCLYDRERSSSTRDHRSPITPISIRTRTISTTA